MSGQLIRFFCDLESVALVAEGSDLKDNFVPTANCIRDTNERQLMTRSGLQRQPCCVCHLHHERTMTAPGSVRKFFKKVLQQEYNFKVDVIAGDANAAAYKYFRKQEYHDLGRPIGKRMIGTIKKKCTRLRYGSHISRGNEIIFIDPHKGIRDDENNVCL